MGKFENQPDQTLPHIPLHWVNVGIPTLVDI